MTVMSADCTRYLREGLDLTQESGYNVREWFVQLRRDAKVKSDDEGGGRAWRLPSETKGQV